MARNPLIRKQPKMTGRGTGGHKSAGILDDYAVRKVVQTQELRLSGLWHMFGGFEDIFGSFFGQRNARHEEESGEDLRYDIEIDLEDVYFGCEKEINYYAYVKCKKCNGSGASSKSKIQVCNTCHGKGFVTQMVNLGPIRMQNQGVCPSCRGKGKSIKDPCNTCNGKGRIKDNVEIKVKIPKGINEGQRI